MLLPLHEARLITDKVHGCRLSNRWIGKVILFQITLCGFLALRTHGVDHKSWKMTVFDVKFERLVFCF